GARRGRTFGCVLASVDAWLGCVREVVDGHEELAGEQAPASELGPEPPLLDETLEEDLPLLAAPRQGRPDGRLMLAQSRDEALGESHDLHASADVRRLRVELQTDSRP